MLKVLLLAFFVALISFTACNKEASEQRLPRAVAPMGKSIVFTGDTQLKRAKLPGSALKTDFANYCKDYIQKLSSLRQQPSIKALQALLYLEPKVGSEASTLNVLFKIAQAISIGKESKVIDYMGTLNDVDSGIGNLHKVYTYNRAGNRFIKSWGGEQFEIHFPVQAAANNNATLSIRYLFDENDGVDRKPTSVHISLKIGGKEELCLASEFEYNNDGQLQKSHIVLKIGPFQFLLSAGNDNGVVTANFTLSKTAETLLRLHANDKVYDFSLNKVNDINYLNQMFYKANVILNFMNIKLVGFFGVKQYNAHGKLTDYPNLPDREAYFYKGIGKNAIALAQTEKAYQTAMLQYEINYRNAIKQRAVERASCLNNDTRFIAINTVNQTVFANVEFRPSKYFENFCYKEYHRQSGSYNKTCKSGSWYSVNPILILNDKSRLTFNTFCETGFDRFMESFGDVFNNFN